MYTQELTGVTSPASVENPADAPRGAASRIAASTIHVAHSAACSRRRRRRVAAERETLKIRSYRITTIGAATIDSLAAIPAAHAPTATMAHAGRSSARIAAYSVSRKHSAISDSVRAERYVTGSLASGC